MLAGRDIMFIGIALLWTVVGVYGGAAIGNQTNEGIGVGVAIFLVIPGWCGILAWYNKLTKEEKR